MLEFVYFKAGKKGEIKVLIQRKEIKTENLKMYLAFYRTKKSKLLFTFVSFRI